MATRISHDPTRIATRRGVMTKRLQEDFDEFDIDLNDAFEDRFNSQSADSRKRIHDAIQLLRGTDEFELVQMKSDTDVIDTGPRGLPLTATPTGRRLDEWAQVYENDGSTIATDIERVRWDNVDGINHYGLIPFDRPDGTQALKKRAAAPSVPSPVAAADRMVDVKDKKGTVKRQVKLKEGIADPKLEAILDDDGSAVDHFKEKSIIIGRG